MKSAAMTSALASRAREGDADALEVLLDELTPLVVRTVRLVVGSGSWAAEDAAKDALLEIARGIQRLRDPSAVRTWALRVATRRALRAAQKDRLLRLRRTRLLESELMVEPPNDRAVVLKEGFDRLPPCLRATAVLRLTAGLTEAETAAALGCSVGTVKSNLHDARTRLMKVLREAGYVPTTTAREIRS